MLLNAEIVKALAKPDVIKAIRDSAIVIGFLWLLYFMTQVVSQDITTVKTDTAVIKSSAVQSNKTLDEILMEMKRQNAKMGIYPDLTFSNGSKL